MAALVHALICWLDDPEPGLGDRLDRIFTDTVALLAEAEG
jgi:hypothetical protein